MGSIPLDIVYGGIGAIEEEILSLTKADARIIICDALREDDIEVIAEAVLASGQAFVAADPWRDLWGTQ